MAERTGQVLGGRYELDEVLGYGGMAEVYHGRDVRLGRDVAVKVLRADLARDPSFQARFRREAQSAASLNHPDIVSVYDTGQDDGETPPLPYIVMEYVQGRTLRDLLQDEGGRLTPDRAVEIVADVCSALEYSHRAGIVHRDIKPANVMLSGDGSVKVMDFGIARAMASSSTVTQTAAVMGTAQYLSPEQAQGDPVDARSDVYSTGCLLYELLTGVPPFRGDSAVALAYQHVREDPKPPSDVDPDLSPDLDAVVLKALAKNPGNRYQDAGEMRSDLLRVLHGEQVLATPLLRDDQGRDDRSGPVPLVGREGDRRSRRPLAVLLGFLLLLGLIVGGGLLARSLLDSKQVTVPDVNGVTVAVARQRLQAVGLQLGTQTPQTSTLAAGLVVRQEPTAQQRASSGDSVDVVVSSGPGNVTVPSDLVGQTAAAAEGELRRLQLVPRSVTVASSATAGTVDSVSPLEGQAVPVGSTVTLNIATPAVASQAPSASQAPPPVVTPTTPAPVTPTAAPPPTPAPTSAGPAPVPTTPPPVVVPSSAAPSA